MRIALLAMLSCSFVQGADIVFADTVMPVLREHCLDCHAPEDSEGGVIFLDAALPEDMDRRRSPLDRMGVEAETFGDSPGTLKVLG